MTIDNKPAASISPDKQVEQNTMIIKHAISHIIKLNREKFKKNKIVSEYCLEIWADCIRIEKALDTR